MKNFDSLSTNVKTYLSGCFGGLLTLVVFCPMEVAKITAQKNAESEISYSKELGRILSERGIRGAYSGLSFLFLRDVPTFGIYFFSYE